MFEIISVIPMPVYPILIFVVLVWFSASFQKSRFIYKNFIEIVCNEYPDEEEVTFKIGKDRSLTMKDQSLEFYYKNELVSTAGIKSIITENGSVQRNIKRFDKPFRKELEEWMKSYIKDNITKVKDEKQKNINKIEQLKQEYEKEMK